MLVLLRRSCAELVKGIKGLVVMSADLDQVSVGVRSVLVVWYGVIEHRHCRSSVRHKGGSMACG
jgi:hypothetical protein